MRDTRRPRYKAGGPFLPQQSILCWGGTMVGQTNTHLNTTDPFHDSNIPKCRNVNSEVKALPLLM